MFKANEKILKYGYFDIHCHILPGVDDGPLGFEEALRMLYIAYEEGIRIVVATPHYRSGGSEGLHNKIMPIYEKLKRIISEADLDITILIGNEILFNPDIIEALARKDALSIDGTRYILIEFLPSASYREIWNGVNYCIFGGYIPIIAHIERYYCLIKNPRLVEGLIKLGAYIQMNLSGFAGSLFSHEKRFCRKVLKKGWVHFLATDAHGAYDRTPQVRKYIKILHRYLNRDKIYRLLWDNPMTMLENKHI